VFAFDARNDVGVFDMGPVTQIDKVSTTDQTASALFAHLICDISVFVYSLYLV